MKGVILLAVIHALIIYQSQKKQENIKNSKLSSMAVYAGNQTINKPSENILGQTGKIIMDNSRRYAFMPFYSRILVKGR